TPPLNPLPACGEGRQSVALAGWGFRVHKITLILWNKTCFVYQFTLIKFSQYPVFFHCSINLGDRYLIKHQLA
ncbi:hypothetical protein, partial [Nostoc sp. 2RC]|uniref:hypothetical protein n=1 Tax=Nostoc sp. 2RC TaxID=2485484 RepID=UPI001C88ED42